MLAMFQMTEALEGVAETTSALVEQQQYVALFFFIFLVILVIGGAIARYDYNKRYMEHRSDRLAREKLEREDRLEAAQSRKAYDDAWLAAANSQMARMERIEGEQTRTSADIRRDIQEMRYDFHAFLLFQSGGNPELAKFFESRRER